MPARPLVSMIVLNDAAMPPAKAVFEQLTALWSGVAAPEEVTQLRHGGHTVLSFQIGEDHFAVTLMPAAIPWADLEGPCRAAWYYWPEAAERVQEHTAHLLLVMKPGPGTPTELAMRQTRVTAAVASALGEPVGIVWGGSGRIHEPSAFIETCRRLPPGILPVELWIGFSLLQENDGTHSIYTDGMESFGLMEVEVHRTHRDPQRLYARVFDVVHYMLKKNIIFKPNETFGMTDEEQVTVEHGPSRAEPENRAIILGL